MYNSQYFHALIEPIRAKTILYFVCSVYTSTNTWYNLNHISILSAFSYYIGIAKWTSSTLFISSKIRIHVTRPILLFDNITEFILEVPLWININNFHKKLHKLEVSHSFLFFNSNKSTYSMEYVSKSL